MKNRARISFVLSTLAATIGLSQQACNGPAFVGKGSAVGRSQNNSVNPTSKQAADAEPVAGTITAQAAGPAAAELKTSGSSNIIGNSNTIDSISQDSGVCSYLDLSEIKTLPFEVLQAGVLEGSGESAEAGSSAASVSKDRLAKAYCGDNFTLLGQTYVGTESARKYTFTCKPATEQFSDRGGTSQNTYAFRVEVNLTDANSKACTASGIVSTSFVFQRVDGCFDPATTIRMSDGTLKRIDGISQGESVFNPVTKKSVKIGRIVVGTEGDKNMYELGYDINIVKVTQTHPFPTKQGIKTASQLGYDDLILSPDGKYYQISYIKKLPINPSQVVINFELDLSSKNYDDHMVEANGVVAGDLYIQNNLAGK